MTFRQAVLSCFRKYATFSGRASRSEYWWFWLFCLLGALIAGIAESIINAATGTPEGPTLLSGAFNLVTLIPGLAVGWRRMHDTGRSGLYLLYPLIAVIGLASFLGLSGALAGGAAPVSGLMQVIVGLALLVIAISPLLVLWWLTRPSQPGPNPYGPNPHEVNP
jgi:uncharacterized membrane protein YhaH (DUF805 family)